MERVVLSGLGVKIVQVITDDPDAARCRRAGWCRRRARTGSLPGRATCRVVGSSCRRMRTTTRLRAALAMAVEDGRDQSEVAAAHLVSWPTVQRAVVAHGAVEPEPEPEPATVLGMDETGFGRPRCVPDG